MNVAGCRKENCAKVFFLIHQGYHLIATASKDHKVGIFKLSNKPDDGYSIENIAMLPVHVEWNITGNILSSSRDDGKVRLWESSHNGEWKCISVISYE
ncbi:hypothetical protein C2G38_2093667 [Gigaspora rosea]|uniref:WD40-repeat-containing domain protein n=1 Tax=Gigaspora rosea TaxID=44941 RepID=A0A397V5N1_9GLOM|nr:hypothetical protein C2G38_2093667 [Gigaspora rosea]